MKKKNDELPRIKQEKEQSEKKSEQKIEPIGEYKRMKVPERESIQRTGKGSYSNQSTFRWGTGGWKGIG